MQAIFKWVISLAIISIIIASAYWLYHQHNSINGSQSESSASNSLDIDWVMHHATIKLTNKKGQTAAVIHSQTNKHLKADNTIKLTRPEAELYSKQNNHWHVESDHGYIERDHQNLTHLEGHVILHRQKTARQTPITVLTDKLHYNPQTKIAYTNQPVTITRPNTLLHAKGLRANLKQGQIEFYHESQIQCPSQS